VDRHVGVQAVQVDTPRTASKMLLRFASLAFSKSAATRTSGAPRGLMSAAAVRDSRRVA